MAHVKFVQHITKALPAPASAVSQSSRKTTNLVSFRMSPGVELCRHRNDDCDSVLGISTVVQVIAAPVILDIEIVVVVPII